MSILSKLSKLILSGVMLIALSVTAYADDSSLVVVSKQSPADILPAATLSNYIDSELLILDKTKADSYDLNKSKDIIVVGGEKSLNDDLFKGIKITRLSGRDRYETSRAVLEYANKHKNISRVNLISGKSYADGVVASSSKNLAVLISDDEKINSKIKDDLDSMNISNRMIIGGRTKVDDKIKRFFNADRLSGKDRYDTLKVFSGESQNGYVNSEAYNFYGNVLDAKKSVEENKGFVLVRPDAKKTVITINSAEEGPKYEIGEFLIDNNEQIFTLLNELEKEADRKDSKLVSPRTPSNTAFPIVVKNGDSILYIDDNGLKNDVKELHIAISRRGSYPKEYIVKDRKLIKNIIDTVNTSIFDEYSI